MPSDAVVLAVNVGLLGLVFAVGFAVDRYAQVDARRRALPLWGEMTVAIVALGTMMYLFGNPISIGVVDESVFAIGAFVGLWLGSSYVVAAATGVEPASTAEC